MSSSKVKRLSAVVITKNEEHDIAGCLESAQVVADDLVVIDNNSMDATVELAQKAGARIFHKTFVDYASQKQHAVDQAQGEWVLSIDADERVSKELAQEIERLLAASPAQNGFEIPFEVVFLGKVLRFGGLGGEKHLRLFRRSSGRFVGGKLHEGVDVKGEIGRLSGKIVHTPYRDLDEYFAKLDWYTTLAAKKRFEQGVRFSPLHLLLPVWEFFVRVFLRLGILDGYQGLTYAGLSSLHTWVKFRKLRQLERGVQAEVHV